MKKTIVVIILAAFCVCLVFAFVTKNSFSNDINDAEKQNEAIVVQRNDEIVSYEPEKKPVGDEDEEKYIAYSLLKADIIVEAEAVGKTEILNQAALSTLKVKRVYKGDIKEGELFDFYQPTFFTRSNSDKNVLLFSDMSFFNLIQSEKTYVVFANKKDYFKEYENTLERKVYKFANINISWFLAEKTNPPILSSDSDEIIKYGDIRDNEFLCFSKKQRNSINAFKERIMKDIIKNGVQ